MAAPRKPRKGAIREAPGYTGSSGPPIVGPTVPLDAKDAFMRLPPFDRIDRLREALGAVGYLYVSVRDEESVRETLAGPTNFGAIRRVCGHFIMPEPLDERGKPAIREVMERLTGLPALGVGHSVADHRKLFQVGDWGTIVANTGEDGAV